jgi:hypothetical protein
VLRTSPIFAGGLRLGGCLRLGELLHIEAVKVDRFENQRRIAGIANGIGDNATREREHQARRFAEEELVRMLRFDIAQPEKCRIFQLYVEMYALFGLCLDAQLQQDFVDFIADRMDFDIDLHIDLRAAFPAIAVRRIGIFDRKILDILAQHADRGRGILAIRLQIIRNDIAL